MEYCVNASVNRFRTFVASVSCVCVGGVSGSLCTLAGYTGSACSAIMRTEELGAVSEIEAAYFEFLFRTVSGFDMSSGQQAHTPVLWQNRSC